LAKHEGTGDDAAQCRCFQQSDVPAGHGRLHRSTQGASVAAQPSSSDELAFDDDALETFMRALDTI
jgi:hypothetical protein